MGEQKVPQESLSPLDPNLPLIASQAAMELDSLARKQPVDAMAARRLAQLMSNSVVESDSAVPGKKSIAPTAATVFSRAFQEASISSPKTIDDLAAEALDLARRLSNTDGETDLKSLIEFCAALSECATAYARSVYVGRSQHPYRR